ncbi:uncharacterized protein RJT20DRAFT_32056 [Scheffersomyces xylosifermentans]|uniref:uncharacterized protein n=1 Tax=Scheffersomyces xylosifermentans TaxID=1304137 RepID=UPI00315DE6C0
MSTQEENKDYIKPLNEARTLAFTQPKMFPQVLRMILGILRNDNKEIQEWCIKFLRESFVNNDKLGHADKVDLAIDSLDSLIYLSNIKDMKTFQYVIDISSVIYKLVFQYVAENDGCNQVWSKLTELKNSLVNKFQSNFPLPPSDNVEHDMLRNIHTKVELLKFIIIVIDYQSQTTVVNASGDSTPPPSTFSLNKVSPDHSLIKYSNMEYESKSLLDLVLKIFSYDILIPPLLSAILNHSIIIMKRKPQYANKILSIIEGYDTNIKLQSNYQTVEQFKLAKKYVDRSLKVFIQHITRHALVPPQFQNSLSKKLNLLVDRGIEIRKKNIFAIDEPSIKKRKFEGFLNPSKKLKTIDYKNLYSLTDVDDESNNFDITTVPQNILVNMVVNALNKVSVGRLSKALEIISDRYVDAVESYPGIVGGPSTVPITVKKEVKKEGDEEDDDEEDGNFDVDTIYTLPPPAELSFQEKKDHINIIIKNFFNLAKNPNFVNVEDKDEVKASEEQDVNVSKELTKIAIKSWKKDSWIVILTRLASRGMRSLEGIEYKTSPDEKNAEAISDMVRNAIFDYFLENIHGRIDLIIEWLNEEWYSEKVFNEAIALKREQEAAESKGGPVDTAHPNLGDTPVYNKWAGKVLDAMIPFLEPNDRKIFIRLMSDLPYLNEDLVGRIKSLCFDPVRSKIGFLALQFLIMYRPPVKQACVNVLKELGESDQEDLRDEANKLYEKYK